MAAIVATSAVQGEFTYDQGTVKREITRWLNGSSKALLRVADSLDHALVERRSSVAPIDWVFSARRLQESNDVYRAKAVELATRAVQQCLAAAGKSAHDVDLIVSTSCTGFMIPSVDAVIAERLGMRRLLRRLPITEHGCAAGVVALAFATDYLRAHPEHTVLVVAVELPSVTFQPADRRPENIISAAIFGDGAAAALIEGVDRRRQPGGGAVRLLASQSVRFENALDMMGFELRDSGLHIVLSRDIPAVVRREVPAVIAEFLRSERTSLGEIDHFLLHPGGRKILEALEETLALPEGALAVSRDVLRERGNLSSATVLVILHEYLVRGLARGGDRGLMVAFGPGFGAELLLLRWPD
ncbi:MAG: 3-oxoacyl-[acyl-carrier-protein] synthase III C-terminal domain-containing protein [Planctomycetota bacterium]